MFYTMFDDLILEPINLASYGTGLIHHGVRSLHVG